MRKIYAFDFDGTLTTKDTLLEFIRFAKGSGQMFRGFLLFSPLLILMKLHLFPNWKVKQKIFSYFFKGMKIEDFNALCTRFAEQNRHLLRPAGIEKVRQAIDEEHTTVLIISAGIDNWVRPFFDEIDKKTQVLGTQIEIMNSAEDWQEQDNLPPKTAMERKRSTALRHFIHIVKPTT